MQHALKASCRGLQSTCNRGRVLTQPAQQFVASRARFGYRYFDGHLCDETVVCLEGVFIGIHNAVRELFGSVACNSFDRCNVEFETAESGNLVNAEL